MEDVENIGNIKYVDAYYIDTSYGRDNELGETKLKHHEAYGYVYEDERDLVVVFIKTRGEKTLDKKADLIKGLVIPKAALISNIKRGNPHFPQDVKTGTSVGVTWSDIIIVSNQPIYESSKIYTEGTLIRVTDDHIVLKDPETLSLKTGRISNHPVEKPLYYVIPISLITDTTFY